MKARVLFHALVLVMLLIAISACKRKEQETETFFSSSGPSGSGFRASASLAPRASSLATQPPPPMLVATAATIGPRGGTLNSSDGKLSVSIPAGAFPSDTAVQIQPTTNAPEESFGPVYQLSPEGVTFPQPVTLAWHLSDADLARTSLNNLIVTHKAANGLWEAQPEVQRDEATHTVSVGVSHFSQWDLALTLRIEPPAARLFVGDSIQLDAFVGETILSPLPPGTSPDDDLLAPPSSAKSADDDLLTPPSAKSPDDDLLAPPAPKDPRKDIFRNSLWRVNGVPLGNSSVGTIESHITGAYWYENAAHQPATYQAPGSSVPSPNPVTVSFEVTVGKQKMVATALVTVLPRQNHWAGDSQITQADGTRVRSDFTFAPVQSNVPRVRQRFEILNGIVRWSGPDKTSAGCDLHIRPKFHTLGPKDGVLTVDASNPTSLLISGGGQAVWMATYTTYCPNGDLTFPSGLHAAWWPPNPYQGDATTAVDVTPGKRPDFVLKVDGPFGQGTVHLKYIGALEQPK